MEYFVNDLGLHCVSNNDYSKEIIALAKYPFTSGLLICALENSVDPSKIFRRLSKIPVTDQKEILRAAYYYWKKPSKIPGDYQSMFIAALAIRNRFRSIQMRLDNVETVDSISAYDFHIEQKATRFADISKDNPWLLELGAEKLKCKIPLIIAFVNNALMNVLLQADGLGLLDSIKFSEIKDQLALEMKAHFPRIDKLNGFSPLTPPNMKFRFRHRG